MTVINGLDPGDNGGGSGGRAGSPSSFPEVETPPGIDEGQRSTTAVQPGWVAVIVAAIARIFLAFLVGLLLWTVVPALVGWSSHVVLSGSMAPRIEAGDVIVASPIAAEQVKSGQVLVFRDPERPDRTVVHRVVSNSAQSGIVAGQLVPGTGSTDGIVTKGDANVTRDVSVVGSDNVEGIGRLRVRFAGLPVLWATEREWLPLIIFLLGVGVAIILVRRDTDTLLPADTTQDPHEGGDPDDHGGTSPSQSATAKADGQIAVGPTRKPPGIATRLQATALGTALLLCLVTGIGTAQAAFAATTVSPSNAWVVSPYAQFGPGTYVATVKGDNPLFFYRLDEAAGTTAIDSTPNGYNGTYAGGWTLNQAPQPLPRNAGNAAVAGGSTSCISSPVARTNAQTQVYSYEVWFRTTSVTGGKLVGFETLRTGTSTQFDRHLYMNNTGALTFGVWLGATKTISTPSGLNDGNWHQAFVTMGPVGGMRLYVDGFLVVSDPNTASENHGGYWRIGCGSLGSWPTYPTSPSTEAFKGTMANVSVYTTELTAVQVRNHWFAA